jgi:hypothetical protein
MHATSSALPLSRGASRTARAAPLAVAARSGLRACVRPDGQCVVGWLRACGSGLHARADACSGHSSPYLVSLGTRHRTEQK